MRFKSSEEILSLASPAADALGVEIIELSVKEKGEPSVTFFIDFKEEGRAVDLDTCAAFHEALDPVLDEADISFGAAYTLNVSSPGLDRPLKSDRDFKRAMGERVECKLFAPMRGKKYFEGVLKGYDGNTVTLLIGDKEEKFNLSQVAKINKAIDFE